MKTFKKSILGSALLLFMLLSMVANNASAATTNLLLPEPTITYNGQWVAWANDDFWGYSAAKIADIQKNNKPFTYVSVW